MRQTELSVLEQEIINEYQLLLDNLKQLSSTISAIADQPTAQTMDLLRSLERKTGLISTLMKTSVYSIILQQEMNEDSTAAISNYFGSQSEMQMTAT